MTLEERKARANAEMWETVRWFDDECSKICERMDREQGANRKFDGGNEPYRELHKEFAHRMNAIGKKYDLFPKKES